jgi:hypothetical protein
MGSQAGLLGMIAACSTKIEFVLPLWAVAVLVQVQLRLSCNAAREVASIKLGSLRNRMWERLLLPAAALPFCLVFRAMVKPRLAPFPSLIGVVEHQHMRRLNTDRRQIGC